MSFRALQHLRITESTTTGLACPPVPPSGFGYPLDGFLLGEPCRPCFRSAALLGFTLWSFLLDTGASAFPPCSPTCRWQPPPASAVRRTFLSSASASGPCSRLESLAVGSNRYARPPPEAPLGFALLGGFRPPACCDLRRNSSYVLSDSADGGHPSRMHLRVSIAGRLPRLVAERDPF
jgi:hypothetical protein